MPAAESRAPDGALTRFPFAALPGERPDTYLIEDLAVAVVALAWALRRLFALSAALAARIAPRRLAAISNILLIAALIFQLDYTPGYNCAWDTLSGVEWRLGWASEMGCILLAGWPAIVVDLLLYIPVGATWLKLQAAPARRLV